MHAVNYNTQQLWHSSELKVEIGTRICDKMLIFFHTIMSVIWGVTLSTDLASKPSFLHWTSSGDPAQKWFYCVISWFHALGRQKFATQNILWSTQTIFTLTASEAAFNIVWVVFSFTWWWFVFMDERITRPGHAGFCVIWLASTKRHEFCEFWLSFWRQQNVKHVMTHEKVAESIS